MWYTILITLVVDVGGLLLVYALLRDRVRRATSAASQISELREEVSRLVVELNQTTERNVALLEDRISGLSDLLAAADRKIALLQREIEKHDVGAKVYSRLAENAPGARGSPAQQDRLSQTERLKEAAGGTTPGLSLGSTSLGAAGASFGAAGASRGAGSASLGEAGASLSVELSDQLSNDSDQGASSFADSAARERVVQRQDIHQRVVTLSRSGFSPSLIAARVGIPLGEVELIISLERQRMSQPAGEEPA